MPRPLLFCLKSGRSVCYKVFDNNMVKQGSLALRCMAAFFICKYYILLKITIKNGMICMNNHTFEDWIWTLKMENMLGW